MRLVRISSVIWLLVFAFLAVSSKSVEARGHRHGGGLSGLFGGDFMGNALRFYEVGERHREVMESYRADNIRATTEAYDTVSNAADRRDATHYMIRSGKMQYYSNGTAAVGVNFGADYNNGGGNYQPSGNRGGGRRGGGGSGGWWSGNKWVSMP